MEKRIGRTIQNYKALFTILDVPEIGRAWVDDIMAGRVLTDNCPRAWRVWATSGAYIPLIAPRSLAYRRKSEQVPKSRLESDVVRSIYDYFKDDPFGFEGCAVGLARFMDRNICEVDLTRRWMDGGRDATGKYRIGTKDNGIYVDFALEAKCFELSNGVGVRSTSRLISRLRYRQFGVSSVSIMYETTYNAEFSVIFPRTTRGMRTLIDIVAA